MNLKRADLVGTKYGRERTRIDVASRSAGGIATNSHRAAGRQINAARTLIEYEEPRLSAVAVGHMDGTSFAAALERAILRSQQPPPPAALMPPEQHPAGEVKGPFPLRRRNLR